MLNRISSSRRITILNRPESFVFPIMRPFHITLKTNILLLIVGSSLLYDANGQEENQAFFIKSIYEHTLTNAKCDNWLAVLSDTIGGRLAGSVQAEEAVSYTQNMLEEQGLDVWLQPCIVPKWTRGDKEVVRAFWKEGIREKDSSLNALSLGNTIGTGPSGLRGQVIEVFGLDTLDILREQVKDKIVFYNRPMNPTRINTGHAYGEAVDQRVHGASRAGKYGAKAAIVRSMTLSYDDIPHTGVQQYADGIEPIPALAISTIAAERLSKLLQEYSDLEVYIKNNPEIHDSVTSYNVIAEIKGSTYPDEIILVGGHLDSWDVGGGAHDDGAGCVHAMQVFETLKALNYQPKRTLRCVLFMNEENGLGGGKAYAKESNAKKEFHLAAIESDMGGFTPRGFGCSAHPKVFKPMLASLQKFEEYLVPYDLSIKAGGGGADINPLKSQQGLLIGFKPDNSRYFDLHHTTEDVFSNVHARELRAGAAAITSLVYLIDQNGLDE